MNPPLFGFLSRIVGVNWGGAYAIISCGLAVDPGHVGTSSITGANISVPQPPSVCGSALPLASVPPGAPGNGTDFKMLGQTYSIWRSAITLYDAFGNSFCFLILPLSKFPPGVIQLSFGTTGTIHSADVTCIVTDTLSHLSVDTATTMFHMLFTNGKLDVFLDISDVSPVAARWGAAGLIKSVGSMQLAGSFGSNNGRLAIDTTTKIARATNLSPSASVFNWP